MTPEQMLDAAVTAMETLYGLRNGTAVVMEQHPPTLHFHFTCADGRRISAHRPLGNLNEGSVFKVVHEASRQIVRQLQP